MEKVNELIFSVLPSILKFNYKHFYVDYDDETDTLYISFQKPQNADDSVMKGNFIYHYRKKEMVGITVLHAKDFFQKEKVR